MALARPPPELKIFEEEFDMYVLLRKIYETFSYIYDNTFSFFPKKENRCSSESFLIKTKNSTLIS